jgi:hypothetical protein
MPAILLDNPVAAALTADPAPMVPGLLTQEEALARVARVPGYLLRAPTSTWWLVVGWVEWSDPPAARPTALPIATDADRTP